MPTALIGGTVIDGQGGPARPGTTVVIDGSTVAEVSEARQFGSEVDVLDVTGKSIMPGIIDTHMHFSHWGLNLIAYQGSSLMLLAVVLVHIGRVLARRARTPGSKRLRQGLSFGLATMAMIVATPWPGLPNGRPLFRV